VNYDDHLLEPEIPSTAGTLAITCYTSAGRAGELS
jgi:hypothetical protein